MSNKNQKSSNGTQNNSNNAENNTFRTIEKTQEQLTASASRYNERAENGQKITFTKAEQKKASSDAKNADKEGFLPGVFWTGYIVTTDGEKREFSRLDANGISRTFEGVCTWKRATRGSVLDGNASRTAEQREEDAREAVIATRNKAAENSVMFIIFEKIDSDENLKNDIKKMIVERMEEADAIAAEKAQSKESKTAQRERELAEAKRAAEEAEETNRKMIAALLATGQYKDENEIREKLGL